MPSLPESQLKATRGESCGLADHPVHPIQIVRVPVPDVSANRVVGNAQVHGLAVYIGPMTTGGCPIALINWFDGFPKRTTAATWSATSGGIGSGTFGISTPSGTTAEVTKPATA